MNLMWPAQFTWWAAKQSILWPAQFTWRAAKQSIMWQVNLMGCEPVYHGTSGLPDGPRTSLSWDQQFTWWAANQSIMWPAWPPWRQVWHQLNQSPKLQKNEFSLMVTARGWRVEGTPLLFAFFYSESNLTDTYRWGLKTKPRFVKAKLTEEANFLLLLLLLPNRTLKYYWPSHEK